MAGEKGNRADVIGGLALISAAALALVLDNSSLGHYYDDFLALPLQVSAGSLEIAKPLLLWINDGLMAIFFLLVGLEVKREIFVGQLSKLSKAILPVFAAVGGMAVPAGVYLGLSAGDATASNGWAIPAATDIAFAIGVLALVGSRVPPALKVFLVAVAIIDDIGAILIIALFYTAELSTEALIGAAFFGLILLALNRRRVTSLVPYALVGVALWVCVLKSGVHATLAGVIVAFAIPLVGRDEGKRSPATQLEHDLHPYVMFVIMPLFAFANAGIPLAGVGLDALLEPIPLGIAMGLLVGKPVGILLASWIPVRFGLCALPSGTTWAQIAGVSFLAGIGFTMSLFIGTLAFDTPEAARAVRIGVLCGSTIAGVLGYLILRRVLSGSPKDPNGTAAPEPTD